MARLAVQRFDVDASEQPHWGMEDFCSLLGLRPAAKYDTTWERIARAVRDHVPGPQRLQIYRQLATTLLLTYALRNADCHAKNLALLYTSRADVHLSPAYDMLTTSAHAGFQHNPPAIELMGKKTWAPSKNLQKFIAATLGIQPKEQQHMVQAISDAVADVAPLVRQAMAHHPGSEDVGKRMLLAWAEGVRSLRDPRVYAAGEWSAANALTDFSPPPKQKTETAKIGRSPAGLALTHLCAKRPAKACYLALVPRWRQPSARTVDAAPALNYTADSCGYFTAAMARKAGLAKR